MRAGPDGGENLIPWRIVAKISSSHKYKKLMHFLGELEREQLFFTKDQTIARGHLGRDMSDFVDTTRSSFVRAIGGWIRAEIRRTKEVGEDSLEGILTRITVVDLETSSAETEWLSQGREIEGKVKRLPRHSYLTILSSSGGTVTSIGSMNSVITNTPLKRMLRVIWPVRLVMSGPKVNKKNGLRI